MLPPSAGFSFKMAENTAYTIVLAVWLLLMFGCQCRLAEKTQGNEQVGNSEFNNIQLSEGCKPKCKNEGICQKDLLTNETKCVCTYEYHGKSCEKRTKCDPKCENGGNCIRTQADPNGKEKSVCYCAAQGWMGDACELPWKCDPECENGGSCLTGYMNKPYCQCIEGWMGESCQKPIECDPLCENDGNCVQASFNTTGCACKPGWYGKTCEKAAECDPSCKNGGTCTTWDMGNTTVCQCQRGYYGKTCKSEITCNPPCDKKGGHCEFFNYEQNITKCWCDPGFFGELCENTAVCKPKCKNGGTCNFNTWTNQTDCYCTWEWKGNACQYPVRYCEFDQKDWKKLGSIHQECDFTADNKTCNFYCLNGKKDCKTNYICKYKTGEWKPELPKCKQMSEKELYSRYPSDDFCVKSRAWGGAAQEQGSQSQGQ